MMPTSDLIDVVRTMAMALDSTCRFLVLDMCDRLERKTKDNELLAQRIVEMKQAERHAKPITNADRIRSMSDEDLYNFMLSLTDDGWPFACQNRPECDPAPPQAHMCNECFKNWLHQPAEVDHGKE